MFRTYQVLFNRLLMCLDALLIFLSIALAWYVKFDSGWLHHAAHLPFHHYRFPMLVAVVATVIGNAMSGMYRPMRAKSIWSEGYAILKGCLVGLLVLMSILYFNKLTDFSRDVLVLFAGFYVVLIVTERAVIRGVLHQLRRRGFNKRFILMVGWNHAAERFVDTLENQPWFGYHILGYLSDDKLAGGTHYGVSHIGPLERLQNMLREHLVDHVVIALPRHDFDSISSMIEQCESAGVQSLILPDYFDLLPARPRFESFGDMPLIDTRYVPLDDAVNATIKRVFDVAFSAAFLIVFSWLYALIAISVKLSSPGPAIFVQERIGKNRRPFKMYKFRTMRHVDSVDGVSNIEDDTEWTTIDDPRRTGLGTFLRRTSLDELPQFWNVLIGDMSVIGPRPERPLFVDRFKDDVPKYMIKHRVRPGITGWAQVHGWRGDTSIAQRIIYDIEYIENWSLWMDVRIVARTIRNGFVHENAY